MNILEALRLELIERGYEYDYYTNENEVLIDKYYGFEIHVWIYGEFCLIWQEFHMDNEPHTRIGLCEPTFMELLMERLKDAYETIDRYRANEPAPQT